MQETQTTEDIRQKRIREFEQNCERIGGYASCELGAAEFTKRVCAIPELSLHITLSVPRNSLYGSFMVSRTKEPKRRIGVIFEQGRAETVTWNML